MSNRKYGSIKDVAAKYEISVSTAWKWVHEGAIPEHTYLKVGDIYRFDLNRIEEAFWADDTTQKTANTDTPRKYVDVSVYNFHDEDDQDDQ